MIHPNLFFNFIFTITAVHLKLIIVLGNNWNIVSYIVFLSQRIWFHTFAEHHKILHMHQDKFIFAQLVSFLNRNHFNYLVCKYEDDKYMKFLSFWNQLLTLMFGQLSTHENLRNLIVNSVSRWLIKLLWKKFLTKLYSIMTKNKIVHVNRYYLILINIIF